MTPGKQDAAAPGQAARPNAEEIPAEIVAAIAAAATVFLGKNLHIRSIGMPAAEPGDRARWTRQGRALALASHNLRKKR